MVAPQGSQSHYQLERRTFTIEESAQVLGISRTSAYAAARRGELPTVRIGRRYIVPRAALERLLSQGRGGSEPDGYSGVPASALE
jgi:excisionase family DNA binding protein